MASSTGSESTKTAAASLTKVSYYGSFSDRSCGYCKKNGGCSFYLNTSFLTASHYQSLVDRGWRRSGHLLYKPHMKLTCCKHYTIRLPTATFKPTRDQRQTLHKWNRFILGEDYIAGAAKKWPLTREQKKKQQTFNLIETIHAAEYSTLEAAGRISEDLKPKYRFEVTLEPAAFTEEKYTLFSHYQTEIHKEKPSEISRDGFKRFLCQSPIPATTTADGKKLGSYHQLYRLDGRLIALGVLDLLPGCVSGVYLIYHTEFEGWNLGKVSACTEAALAHEGGYGYYYLGYYIPTCQKMRYKATYSPSEILRPNDNSWTPLTPQLQKTLEEVDDMALITGGSNTSSNPTNFASSSQDTANQSNSSSSLGAYDEDNEDDEDNSPSPGFTLRTSMPGLMSTEELESFQLENLKISVQGMEVEAKYLRGFQKRGVLRDLLMETVACVGEDVAGGIVLGLG
ncbi:arginine-tRNA-protein transferase [Pyronema omphalodes]|nr:arginine-tRNA-protein transferase [Pyronema omphalodes]